MSKAHSYQDLYREGTMFNSLAVHSYHKELTDKNNIFSKRS